MSTIDALKEFGADTEEGIRRCVGKEDFYLRLVNKIPGDKSFAALEAAIKSGDLDAAFEAAHSLKGILSNLALKSISTPVEEITELLRAKTEMDYSEKLQFILKKRDELAAILGQ